MRSLYAIVGFSAVSIIALIVCVWLVLSLVKRKSVASFSEKAVKVSCFAIFFAAFVVSAFFLVYMISPPKKIWLNDETKDFNIEETKSRIIGLLPEEYLNASVEFLYTPDEKPRVFVISYQSKKTYGGNDYYTAYEIGFIYKSRFYVSNTMALGWDKENPFIKHGAENKKKYYFSCGRYAYLSDDGNIIGINGEWENNVIPSEELKKQKTYFVKRDVWELK